MAQVIEEPEPPKEVVSPMPSVLTNCYKYAKQVYPTLPPTKTIWQNLSQEPGGVAVFRYPSGLEHYAVVVFVGTSTLDIQETNYEYGKYTKRTIPLDSPSLKGFYHPI